MIKNCVSCLILSMSLFITSCTTQPIQSQSALTLPSANGKAEVISQNKNTNVRPKSCHANQQEVAACQVRGGHMIESGMAQCDMCIVEYADAGKTCRDGSDCMGECIANDADSFRKTNVKGKCAVTNSPFGCRARVENGKSLGILCVD